MNTSSQKRAVCSLLTLDSKIAEFETAYKPIGAQLVALERANITGGAEYIKLKRKGDEILGRLEKLEIQKRDILEPFIAARDAAQEALLELAPETEKLTAAIIKTRAERELAQADRDAMITTLTAAGASNKEAQRAPAVIAFNQKLAALRSEEEFATMQRSALTRVHDAAIANANVVINRKAPEVAPGRFDGVKARFAIVATYLAAVFMFVAYGQFSLNSSYCHALTVVLLGGALAFCINRWQSASNLGLMSETAPSWWTFAFFAPSLLAMIYTTHEVIRNTGWLSVALFIVNVLWSYFTLMNTLMSNSHFDKEDAAHKEDLESEGDRKAQARERQINAGRDALKHDVENALIAYGKKE
jgi:hypothetical protein